MRDARTLQMACRYLAVPVLALVLSGEAVAGPNQDAQDKASRLSYLPIALLPPSLSTYKIARSTRGGAVDGGGALAGSTDVPRFEASLRWQSSLSIAGSRVWSRFIGFTTTGINVHLPLN